MLEIDLIMFRLATKEDKLFSLIGKSMLLR